MNIEIRVINLAVSVERRRRMTEQLAACRMVWSFFEGHTGLPGCLAYDPSQARRRYGRELTQGELGCFASHFSIWKDLAGCPDLDALCILEDDVLIDPHFFHQIEHFSPVIEKFGILRLYARMLAPSKRLDPMILERYIVRFAHQTYGTQAYLITRNTASHLTNCIRNVSRPIDVELGRFWHHGVQNVSVFPFPVIEMAVPSTIGLARHHSAPLSAWEHCLNTTHKAAEKIRRTTSNAFFVDKHSRHQNVA